MKGAVGLSQCRGKHYKEEKGFDHFAINFPYLGHISPVPGGSQETEKEEELVHVLMIRSGRWGQQHARQVLSRIFLDLSFILHSTFGKSLCSQSYGFSNSHVQMRELGHKEGWMPKNWCFWTVVLEKTLGSPLNSKEIKQVNRKENQPWIWCWSWSHLMWRADSLGKTLILGKIEGKRRRGQQRKRWLDGITDSVDEFEQTQGDSEGQESLACCSSWHSRVRHNLATEQQGLRASEW